MCPTTSRNYLRQNLGVRRYTQVDKSIGYKRSADCIVTMRRLVCSKRERGRFKQCWSTSLGLWRQSDDVESKAGARKKRTRHL